jgi:hypothetical protein
MQATFYHVLVMVERVAELRKATTPRCGESVTVDEYSTTVAIETATCSGM